MNKFETHLYWFKVQSQTDLCSIISQVTEAKNCRISFYQI